MAKDKSNVLERWTWILVVILTAASLGIIWSVFLSSTLGEQLRINARQAENLQREARIFASGLGRILNDGRLSLAVLANQIPAHPHLNPLKDREVLSLAHLLSDINHDLASFKVADRWGRLYLLDGSGTATGISVADRDYFQAQVPYPGRGFFLGKPVVSRLTAQWTLDLSVPVAPNPANLTVVIVSLDFHRMDRLADSLAERLGEVIEIFGHDGSLLYQYPVQPGFPDKGGRTPIQSILATGISSGFLQDSRVYSYQRTEDLPVWVVVSRSLTSLTGQWELMLVGQGLWVLLLTVLIVASAIGLFLLTRRLRRIRLAQAELARIDPLTGLLNRRAFLERCALERSRVSRQASPLSLALLDLDHFKRVNDLYGHQAGDQALHGFAKAVVRAMRSTDAVARTGGEEFAVLMPGTDRELAMEISERIRAEVSTVKLPQGNLTTSIGVASWDGEETFENWFRRADQALYRAKSSGRDRVEAALDTPLSPLPG
jgi:diguanylate cyclase (GGDEF)-like protein